MKSKLREMRMDMGLTQFELAEITAISRFKIQGAENGYATLNTVEIKTLARVLGLKKIPDFLNSLNKEEVSDYYE